MLPKRGITPGFAFDIAANNDEGEPWDFSVETQKENTLKKGIEDEPDLLVGSPMRICF